MSNIIDLDILFEKEQKEVKFKLKDGQEFTLKLEISPEIALYSIKSHKDGKNEMESAAETLSLMIKEQYGKEVDYKYLLKNISFKILLYVSNHLTNEVYEAMDIINNKKDSGTSKKK